MTYETHIVSCEGHMTPQEVERDEEGNVVDVVKESEYVCDRAFAVAVETETGITGEAWGKTDAKAITAAEKNLAARIVEKREQEEAAKLRAAEDPMARLARLEAIMKERGLDG